MVLVDGTLIPAQRRTGKADRRNHSGKHRRHGLRFLALTDERGRPIWISAARSGRTHGITAARYDHILAHLRAAGLTKLRTDLAHAPRPLRALLVSDEPRSQSLTNDLLRRQPPTTRGSTPKTGHTSPFTDLGLVRVSPGC